MIDRHEITPRSDLMPVNHDSFTAFALRSWPDFSVNIQVRVYNSEQCLTYRLV